MSTGKGDPVSEFTFSFGLWAASVEKMSCVGCHELRFEIEFWRDDGPSPEAEPEPEPRLEDDVLGGDAASPKKIEEAGELALTKWDGEGSNMPLLGVRVDCCAAAASKEEDGSGPGAPRLSGEYAEEVTEEEEVDVEPEGECCGMV